MSHRLTFAVVPQRLRAVAALCAVALLAAPVSGLLPDGTGAASAAEPTPALSVKVNFQPDATAVPAGFTKDTGAAYADGAGMGWVRQDSLSTTPVPFAVPLNTRDRSACTALSPQARTFIHMQAPVTNATNNNTPVAWEYALPNGYYQVSVGVGDANSGADAESHTVNVEGVNAVRAFPRSAAANCTPSRLTTGTVTATVTDGKLTVDALGGTNTKLQYVTIDNAPDPVSGLSATPTASSVDVDWADTTGATGYRVYRSSNRPVPTTGAPAATVSGSSWSDTAAVKGAVQYYAVVAVGAGDVSSVATTVGAMMDDPTSAQLPLPAKVDFQDLAGATAEGNTKDYGQNFANVRGYGWVEPGTQTPLNLTTNGRTRTGADAASVADPRMRSLMHMQYPAAANPANGNSTPGAWELTVPNGNYDVELAVGDPTPGTDTTSHEINVEGSKLVDDFTVTGTTTGAARFKVASATGISVTDGRLTVDAVGGTNTKIDYITVTPTPADALPAAPAALAATAGNAQVVLDWADNTDGDLAGYHVYRSTGATVDTAGTPLTGTTPVSASTFTDTTAVNGTTYRYAVVALDAAGQRSAASTTVTATPQPATPVEATLPLKVAFSDEAGAERPGYLKDFGRAFTNAAGRGWVVPGSATPLDLVGNGRTREVRNGNAATLLQRGLVHVQGDDVTPPFTGVATEGAYEVAVPNGSYQVSVSVGDQPGATKTGCPAPCYDSTHSLRVEGTPAITRFQATAAEEFALATVRVVVTDGRLTVDAVGGTNTKINYLEVADADATPPAVPADLRAVAGDGTVLLSWDAGTESDLASYRVYRSEGGTVAVGPETLLATQTAPTSTWVDATAVNGRTYTYAVTAVDADGNASAASATATATPVDRTAPRVPQDLVAVAGDAAVDLRWTADADADRTTFRVYRSTSSPVARTEANLIGTPDAGSYRDEGRTNGTALHYVVTAVDAAGNESAPSTERSATPTAAADVTPPATPTGLQARAGDNRVTLTWAAVLDEDLDGYLVYRSTSAGGPRTALTPAPVRGESFTDTTALNGVESFYVIAAADLAGNLSPTSGETSATPVDTTAPAAPVGVTATAGVNSVVVRWDANTETDLRGYRIYRNVGSTVPVDEDHLVALVTRSGGRAFLDSDLEAGTAYSYVITAEDTLRNASAASARVTATPKAAPDTTAPPAPGALTATVDGTRVALTWTAATAADLAGYNVYRSASAGGARVKLNATPLSATTTTYTDASAPAGATSWYVVTAVDTSNNESAASPQASAATAAAGTELHLSFQADGAVPAGYTRSSGAAYSAATGSGWVREDTLSSATRTPLDLTTNTRLRTRTGIDPRQNSVIHMHYGDIVPTPTGNGVLTNGAYEHSLPNGRYRVTVSVGDQPGAAKTGCAAPCYDSVHTVHVEGATAVNAFRATAAEEYRTGTVTVDVTDGRLTVDALGSSNTKMNYLDVVSAGPVAPDTTAPAAPSALTALAGDGSAVLSWGAPADGDVAGYHVYRSSTPTVAVTAANRVDAELVETTSFTDTGLTNGQRWYYAVTAVDTSGNESEASAVRDVTPAPFTGFARKVDFQDADSTPATGYLADWGQAYGARSSTGQGTGNTYGWVNVGTSSPLSLVGNGRNRNLFDPPANQSDQRLATMLHMQYAGGTQGVTVPGSWEMAVPNGAYTVTVALGDAATPVDSVNWLNIENQNAVAAHVPTAGSRFTTATRTVVVTDGRLTLSPAGGTNTKIAYVDLASLDTAGRPYPTAVHPTNGEIGVVTNSSVTTDNQLNAETGAVDEATLATTVTVTRVSDGVKVPGHGATSGGGDTVSFQADAPMAAGTLYRFDITEGAKDKSGRAFLPFSSVFTTAAAGGGQPPAGTTAAFDKGPSGASAGKSYTSLVVGPDGKLYAGSIYGQIYRWTINPADGSLSNEQVITTVRDHATAKRWEGAPNRTVIGLAFDPASTATNPVLWITDNYAYLGQEVPNATGAIARLSGPNLETYQEVVVNLPRSIKDHETNSLAFKNGKIYVIQGSMNAMGAAEGTWKKEEHLLSAAILELDPTRLGALPLDAATPDLQAPARDGVPAHQGTYDPYAPGAPLTLYATGIRNGYDLVWHSNGHLYTGVNGSAAGGAVPATPATYPASCAKRPDGGYTGPSAPQIRPNNQAETDYIFDVHKGKYYGHPNPVRCEYVLNAGNPVGYSGNPLFKVNAYPLGQAADPNYDLAHVYDAGLHASANGSIEYKNTQAFGGAFAGKLVVVRYSANQEVVAFDVASGTSVSTAITGIAGFTGHKQPLDVAEDVATGNLYVSQLTDNPGTTGILLLKPQGGTGPAVGSAQVTPRLVFTDVKGGAASAAQSVVVRNAGNGPLTVRSATVSGADASLFTTAGQALPTVVPSGGQLTLPVTFNPTVAGPRGAVLTLTTDDPRAATVTTTLRGLGTDGLGGSLEPSLQWVLDTLQIPVAVGDPVPSNNDMSPGSAPIGDEVLVSSFTKAAFDHVVQVEPLSLFGPAGPAGNPNVVTVGVHTTGKVTERTPLFRGPNSSNQTVLPAVTTLGEYDLETPFGFDFTWHGLSNRTAWSEDALNTWDTANPHKVRVYPLKNADGTLEPFAYVVAPEDVASPVDFQDAAVIVRNVKPFDPAGGGTATTSASELVFSGVRGSTSAAQSLVVTNGGAAPLTISGAALSGTHAGSFALTGGAQTVEPGATGTFTVTFRPASTSTVGYQSASLRLTTDSTRTPTIDVGLFGLATTGEQGNNEPPLKAVVDTLGRPINVGGTGLILGINPAPIGDEVAAPLFVKAGAAPVTMKPVARYSPDELLPFGWYSPNSGDAVHNEVGVIALDNEQTLNPRTVAGGTGSFDPGTGSFGFFVDSKSFGRKSYTQDALNTNIPHAVRTYPAKDRTGAVLPDTYLVTFEDAQNGDYQDYVFEVSGVRPASSGGNGSPVARIDFVPSGVAPAAGYTADNGLAYNALTGTGWMNAGRTAGLDMSALTRDRAGTQDARLRHLILMQPTPAQSAGGDGVYEYALPSGTYTVTVSAGDPDFTDSVHTVRVEGQIAVNAFAPTTGERSRAGTVTVPVTDGRLTVDAVGGTNTKLQYVDIDRVQTGADTTAPTVSAALSGLQQSPGSYKNGATLTVVASDSGSGIASSSYSLDGGPFVPYAGAVQVTTLGSHTVQARAQDVAGNVATSAVTTFSVVAAGASRANVVLENADGVPYADRLVMSRIQRPETGTRCRDTAACDPVTGPFFPANVVHDVVTLRVRNTGTEGLNVTGLSVTGPFALATPQTLPALVPAGGVLEVPVRFTATTLGTAGGYWDGTLTVSSDDADEATLPVQLAGFWQSQSEGGQEPDVAEIARTFGYTTTITSAGTPLNQNGLVRASGDEVLSPYWVRANPAQPVTVRQLAAYHTQGNTATARWHAKGSGTTTNLFVHAGVEGQTVLPHRNGSTTVPASATFAPTTPFGFNLDGEWSDPTRNNQTVDQTNGCTGPCGHHVRFWPVRDRAGAIVPGSWLMGMDYSGINYDYNDNVYLVTNAKPETAADPSAPALLPGAPQLALGFDAAYPGTLVDKDGTTTGFTSTQPNKNDGTPGSSSYAPALLDVVTAAPGTLAVTSSGTATAGTNGSNDNTLVNGLRVAFDGTGDPFSVTGRLLGPVTMLDVASEQEGVMFGPGQDDYVKAAAILKNGVQSVEFYVEQGGVGTTVATAALPSPAAISTLELALVADPAARTVKAAFRTTADGAWTVLPQTLTLSATTAGRFFDRSSYAGVLVSHKGGAPFTATYDAFAVAAGDVTGAAPGQGEALYRLDVAGAGTYTDTAGRTWTPDTGRYTPATAPAEGASATQEIAGTQDDVLYRTYRGNVGAVAQDQRVLSYALPTRAVGTVDVRLHFAERAAGNNAVGRRVFDIEAEGKVVRSGFDVYAAAGALNTAVVLPLKGIAVKDGRLDLAFRASSDYPSIAAIEVLCQGTCPVDTTAPAAPTAVTATSVAGGVQLDWADNVEADVLGYTVQRVDPTGTVTTLTASPVSASAYLDTTAPAGTALTYRVLAVDSSENASAPSTVAITTPAAPTQAPVRINTGGPAQTVAGTTWSACSSATACSGWVSGGNAYSEADTITGIPTGMNNTIFQSEWTGGAARGARAFGFDVPVQNGRYSVRLHFAELNKFAAGARTFSVDLEKARILTDFDVFVAAGGADRAIVRSFTTTVTDGKVTLDFLAGVENAKISAIEVLPLDTTPPAAVTGVSATATDAAVTVGWSASTATDLAGYDVFRAASPTGTFTKLNAALLTSTSYADTTAPRGVASSYRVVAVDTAGNAASPSAVVTATRPGDTTAPAAVTGLTATGAAAGNSLAWAASTASDLAGYAVYRADTATGTYTRLTTAVLTGTSYTDTTAPEGVARSYQVTAIDTAGNESARSATATATRPDATAPAVVTGVTATGTTAGNTVAWSASTAGDLAGYAVYRADSPTGTYTRLTAAVLTGTSFTDTSAPEGVARSYLVTALDRSGNESARSATATATRVDASAPAALTGVTATGTATGNVVSWTASPASDLAGYAVYRADTATGTYTRLTTAVLLGTSYTDTTAPEGVARSYQVTALDRSGNESARSATATATRPDGTPPPAVTGVVATGTATGVTLTWSASTATDLAGYDVLRATTATGTFVKLNAALLTTASYSDTTAPTGASFYRVVAVDRTGNASAPSTTVQGTRQGAQDAIRINTGGPAVTTGGVAWAADQYFSGGKVYTNPQVSAIAGTTDDVLYRTERSSLNNGGAFSYAVPVASGTYDVRLHFAEIWFGATGGGPAGTGRRVFNVNLEGGPVEIQALDLNAVASPMTAIVRTVRVPVTDGQLTMSFNASVNQPKVSAFEVLPVDTTAPAAVTGVTAAGSASGVALTWAPGTDADLAGYAVFRSASETGTFTRITPAVLTGTSYTDAAAPAGATSYYRVAALDRSGNTSAPSATVSATRPGAARTPIRINAGNGAQTVGSTTWSACSSLTACSGWVSGGFRHVETDTITGVPAGMNQNLFRSEWTGGATNGVPAGARAFGFDVPVTNGAYTVRLHFAELSKTAAGQRVFDVRLEGTTVLNRFDVFAAAGGAARAVARDFPVTVTDGRVTLDFIRQVENAKISAIEILPVG